MADLTITEAGYLADLIRAVERNAHIRYYPNGTDDTDHPVTAVLRCFAHQGGGLWFDSDGDVRDAYVHMSGMFERWLKVSGLLAALDNAISAVHGWDKPMLIIEPPEPSVRTAEIDAAVKVVDEGLAADQFASDEPVRIIALRDMITAALQAAAKARSS